MLLWENHGRAGVDGQRQSVVEVHVIQPVVVHLQQQRDTYRRKVTVRNLRERQPPDPLATVLIWRRYSDENLMV